jgi:glycosyltransferase involved in cell wall biosynthesis
MAITDVHLDKTVLITLPVLLTGGTEFQTMALVKVLCTAGYRVKLCCFYDFEQGMVANMEKAGAQVVLLKLKWKDGLLSLLIKLFFFFRKEKPDICHVQYMAPGFISVVAARLAGVPVIFATVHQPGHPYGKKAHVLIRTAAMICTQFICISKSVEQSWFGSSAFCDENFLLKKHCTIYNAVDCDAIMEATNDCNKSAMLQAYHLEPYTVIGCVARLRQEKGQKILLLAFAEVVKFRNDVKLLMVGDGPDMSELLKLSDSLGLSHYIIWLGRQEQANVFRLYGIMQIVIVPSFFEGFGLSAAEAMSAGLPVIASNIDGLAEVVLDGETGELFPVGDSHALASSLLRIINNTELVKRYGNNGRGRVRKYFAMEAFSQSMLKFYEIYN